MSLLGVINSYLCDWWARRFVDRHVTRQVIDNLPLPDWTAATRRDVAALVAGLLVTSGVVDLPGGHTIGHLASQSPVSPVDLASQQVLSVDEAAVAIEKHVLAGFGCDRRDVTTILADFTKKGCSNERRAMLEGLL